jgi:hypothetical protein
MDVANCAINRIAPALDGRVQQWAGVLGLQLHVRKIDHTRWRLRFGACLSVKSTIMISAATFLCHRIDRKWHFADHAAI